MLLWLGVLALGVLQRTNGAHAADTLDIPASCGSQAELEREIAALHGGMAARTQRPDVQLTQEGDEYVLEVSLPEGARTLRDGDCRALFRAAVIIAALGHESSVAAVLHNAEATLPGSPPADSGARAKPERHEATVASQAPRQPSVRLSRPPEHHDATAPSAPLKAYVLAHADALYGVVPAWSAALGAGLLLERGRWGGRMRFDYLTPRTHHAHADGVRIDGLSALVSLEAALVRWLKASLGAEIFFLRGRGLSVLRARTNWAVEPMLHAGLEALLFERGRFGLELGARALWAPQPSAFTVRGRGPVYRAQRFGFQAGFALRVKFL